MFLRLLLESFRRQRRRKLLAGIAILLGTTAVTAMLALATTIGDRIHRELAVYGANIVVFPLADQLAVKIGGVDLKPATGGAFLKESDLNKLKTIFWANNISGLSPELALQVQVAGKTLPALGLWFDHPFGNSNARTGADKLHPAWKIAGRWPLAPQEAVVGAQLARTLGVKPGDTLTLADADRTQAVTLVGVVNTGDVTDTLLLLPLLTAQTLAGQPDAISRVDVAARTKPEDAFARKDPDSLPAKQREIWYCRPYANSIAYQIREAIPAAQAEQVRRVEQSEGTLLERIGGLMWLVSGAALLAAGFAVSAAMATAVLERRREIGLMRSLGASKGSIALLFYAETGLLAVLCGGLGYLAGSGLAYWLGARIFAGDAGGAVGNALNWVLLPVVVAMALLVAIAGSTPSIRSALRMDPSAILRVDG
jgi:putative ABC transport system permease protein